MESINFDQQTDEQIATQLMAEGVSHSSVIHSGALGALLNRPGGPERYGSIFLLMTRGTTRQPAVHADYVLSAVYGLRNGAGKWNERHVYTLLDEADRLIGQLPEDEEKAGLARRHLYHLSLVQREVYSPEHFLRAAVSHEEAAEIAPTPAKRAIELVVAAVERGHHAVEMGKHDLFGRQMDALAQREKTLNDFAPADQEAAKWAYVDVPIHRAYMYELMGLDSYPEMEEDIFNIASIPAGPFAAQYVAWLPIMNGFHELYRGHWSTALTASDRVVAAGGHPTHVIFGLYIAALAMRGVKNDALAREFAERAMNYDAHGGHFVRAALKQIFHL